MPLQAFSFPLPETRFVKAGQFIYKFKIRGGSSYSGEDVKGDCFHQELEEIIRTVLGNLDVLQPFSSTYFNVFPYKRRWEQVSEVMCRCERKLRAYPSVLVLYLEKSMQSGEQAEETMSPNVSSGRQRLHGSRIPSGREPQSKRCKRDSPLEEAILKDTEAESGEVSVVSVHKDNPHAEEELKEDPGHVDKRGTMGFDESQQSSGVNTDEGSGTPGEVHPGTVQAMGEEEEEEDDEEGENADVALEAPVRPGVLTRLASHIFPFSMFLRDS